MELTLLVAAGSLAVGVIAVFLGRMDKRRDRQRHIEVRVADMPFWQPAAVQRWGWSGLEVYWEKARVNDPRLVQAEFRNVGRIELKCTDLSEPPTVETGDAAILAACAFLRTGDQQAPRSIARITRHGDRIEVPGVLLNPGDMLTVQLLLDGGSRLPMCYLHASGFHVTTGDQTRASVSLSGAVRSVGGKA
jgi:hypothetical protein